MSKLKRNISNIIFLLKPYWRYGKLYCLLSLFSATVPAIPQSLSLVYMTQQVIDALTAKAPLMEIIKISVFWSALYVAAILVQSVLSYTLQYRQMYIMAQINRSIFEQAIATDYKYIDDPNYYDKYQMATQMYANQASQALNMVGSILQMMTRAATMFAVIATLGPWIILFSFAGAVLSLVFQIRMNKISVKETEAIMPPSRKMSYVNRVVYVRENAADFKTTRVWPYISEMYAAGVKEYITALKRFMPKLLGCSAGQTIASRLSHIAIVAYIAGGILTGSIASIGMYAGLLAAAEQLTSSFSMIFSLAASYGQMLMYVEKIREFFSFTSKIETSKPDNPAPVPDAPLSVELRNANFGYRNSSFSLKNVNINIAAGEKIAVVGENGAGKTTLSKLLLRLYDLDGGEVLINGIPIKDYDIHELRRHIGIAFQNTSVYALPFAENLQTYRKADLAKLQDTINAVGLGKYDLNADITREFSENGLLFSGGEIQKLAIARLLVGEFGLLLLDEPSSALDPLAEYEMNKLIFSKASSTTTIMIAHRLSTIRDADRIYLIDNGEVAEVGTHYELMKLGGKYAEMFSKQAENYVKK